jgi:ribokinase
LILVIGNAVTDLSYPVQAVARAGETVLATGPVLDVGGKGLNQAVMARRAGSQVRLLAVIGSDAHGERIEQQLRAEGIDAANLLRREGLSDHSIIQVGRDGENAIISVTSMARSLGRDQTEPLLDRLGPADSLLLQGNLTREVTEACLIRTRRRAVRSVVNPAPIAFDYQPLWPLIDVAILNQIEATTLTGESAPEAAARRLRAFGVGLVAVTLGRAGALLAHEDRLERIAATAVTAVDSTGAGDVFSGVFAAGLDQGLTPGTACRWAVAAASRAVTRPGTLRAFPERSALSAFRP